MKDFPTSRSPTRSSPSEATEQVSTFASTTELRKALAGELDRSDFLGRWMAQPFLSQSVTWHGAGLLEWARTKFSDE